MPRQTRVFNIGIIGLPGKGAAFVENYNPNRTMGEIIAILKPLAPGKRIKILKHKFGDISKYNHSDPYWSDSTKLSDYCAYYGKYSGDIELIYCVL